MISDVTNIAGNRIFTFPVFEDLRGGFEVFWETADLTAEGLAFTPVSGCHSYNRSAGTLRAFHYQRSPHGQAKLVSCVAGKVWDVVVDLRPNSPTFRQWVSIELSAGDGKCVYIPEGCAHGFVTLEDNSTLAYLIQGSYVPEASAVVRWDDPNLAVPWPVDEPILSEKDRTAPLLVQ
jgi:dTDP-4-dehydrorhamnose 3,5-epimerase